MPEDPVPRRTVRDFMRHYGVSRAKFMELRTKAIRRRELREMLFASPKAAHAVFRLVEDADSDQGACIERSKTKSLAAPESATSPSAAR